MTTKEENTLLTQTGPGTPGGDLLRRYWQPVALSSDIADGPIAIRVLSEDLVLFRDEAGRPGLLGLHCPHRCADLSYGRVEDGGLRCLYHGWLFDIEGRCLEQPAEPDGSTYKDEVRHKSYPCREAAGAIFAYLGPGAPPLFPGFHFLSAPEAHVHQTKLYHRCNYLQANEGNIDPAHLSYLHGFKKPLAEKGEQSLKVQQAIIRDIRPKIEIERTRFGIRIYAQRHSEAGQKLVRITNYVFPNLGFFAGEGGRSGPGGYSVHWHVPIDDASHWRYDFVYHAHTPLDKAHLRAKIAPEVGPGYRPLRTAEGKKHVRVTCFVLPNLGFFSGQEQRHGEGGYSVHWHVPIDDASHWRYEFYYHAASALDKDGLVQRAREEIGADGRPLRHAGNRYRQDRASMGHAFAGLGPYFAAHDLFAVQTPGAILDRTREHLASTDIAIVASRRMLLDAMSRVARGEDPPLVLRSANENVFNDIVVRSLMLAPEEDPRALCARDIGAGDFHAPRA